MQEAVGRYVHIDLKDPKQGMDSVEGTLQAVGGGSVTVEYLVKGRKKTADVSRENIRLIRLAVK
jgi:ribosome maturation factor RimP